MLFIILFSMFSQVLADVKIHSLPISANLTFLEEGSTIVDRDRARFQALFAKHVKRSRAQTVELKNTGTKYTLSVGFGSPPTYHGLLIDTGSPYTWIGPKDKFVETKTSIKQGDQAFHTHYLSGSVAGVNYKDLVTLSSSLSIDDMEFGVASPGSVIPSGADGILGLGPAIPSTEIFKLDTGKPVPTIMDALFAQKKIQLNVFGLSFAPTTSQGAIDGELTFGGINLQKYKGWMDWVDKNTKKPWNEYWAFEQTIKYGDEILQPSSVGVVDSGTTMIRISPEAFNVYSKSLPGSKIDQRTGLLEISKDSIDKMKSLFFIINGVSYEFTANAQLVPRMLNNKLGGKPDGYYSVIGSLGVHGADIKVGFINGYVFLQRFYTAYDASNSRIGFAHTDSTYANVD
ncbi:hypothetical protein RSAG8_12903, partial [Rhizoctonia solani AG-8 WAC10335]